jgi:hypothetical protein
VTNFIKNKTPLVRTRDSGLRLNSDFNHKLNFSGKKITSCFLEKKTFSDKYTYDRDDLKGVGCSAGVYAVKALAKDERNFKKVVKVYLCNDDAVYEAARNEASILQKLPRH